MIDSVPAPSLGLAPARASRRAADGWLVPALLVPAGTLAGWTLVGADAWTRSDWPYIPVGRHLAGAFLLYTAAGVSLGLVAWALLAVERKLVAARGASLRVRAAFFGLVATLSSLSTAFWTFSGEHVATTSLAIWGPYAFALGCGVAGALGARLVLGALAGATWLRAGATAAALFVAGATVTLVDLTVYVALYSRLHTLLELVAALCFAAAYAIPLAKLTAGAPGLARALRGGAALLVGCLLILSAVSPLRTWLDAALGHVWLEEVYIGRMLRRFQIAEAFFSDPLDWKGIRMSRVERIQQRSGLRDFRQAPIWNEPLAEPPEVWQALRRLRGGQRRLNVLVYYVDTLRNDVARDPATMPYLQSFAGRCLDFRNAYATGSDTLRSLPALTGGNYDVFQTPPNDLLRVAKRADYQTMLVAAKSASEFIEKLRPSFGFDRRILIEDYPATQQVWGYGAQGPTAGALVDRTLELLEEKRDRPWLVWLFNFDQHNWRELDAAYVDKSAQRFGLVDDPNLLAFRYRVIARAIDHEFERLMRGMEQRGLLKDTVVLFVSDHGEALGRDGFWVHSVFLWESLVRVPLLLYVPDLAPKRVEARVSLVDVAPTLGRFADPTLGGAGFHGEDLLGHALPNPPPRRFPLLLLAASKEVLVRIGMLDPAGGYKLVLSLESALPELYDLSAADPDQQNLAAEQPERVRKALQTLLRSPIFPRSELDFEVLDTKEQKALLWGQ